MTQFLYQAIYTRYQVSACLLQIVLTIKHYNGPEYSDQEYLNSFV